MSTMIGHVLVNGLEVHDGPFHFVEKSVLYVKSVDGAVHRMEIATVRKGS